MQLTGFQIDDIVRCDVRGQRFWALVTKAAHADTARGRGLKVRPLIPSRRLPTEFVKANQVIGRWKRMTGATVDV